MVAFRRHTLLTRARYETLIWVPEGDGRDTTRLPATYDAVAAFLTACGVVPLADPLPDAAPDLAQTDLI